MPRLPTSNQTPGEVQDLRYDAKRKNIPPAGIAARGSIVKEKKLAYGYNPHLPPTLRFDATGRADRLNELIAKLQSNLILDPEEVKELAALAKADPWLEWSGKREQPECVVDPIALQVHERISAQAILKVAAREDVPRNLFADPEQDYRDAVQFYQHDVDWSNRLILGDSLAVMASLARREALAGKVQMIFMDPPYGINYKSNFQSEVGNRDVKEREQDLTREPEMVKAYRDTWNLGVHSYLAYLRDRFILCREMLTESGSIFVQISDENIHRVRSLLDEVFGSENAISVISFRKTAAVSSPDAKVKSLASMGDYLIWYAKDKSSVKYRQLVVEKIDDIKSAGQYNQWEENSGSTMRVADEELARVATKTDGFLFQSVSMESNGYAESFHYPIDVFGRRYTPAATRHWSTVQQGVRNLIGADRVVFTDGKLRFKRRLTDFEVTPIGNIWPDLMGASDLDYVVQTNTTVIERCMFMTTDTGDLVLDPTCGSGTTAYVAEQRGRRWITIDSSRVALSIARQRLLTAQFEAYKMRSLSAEDVDRIKDGVWLSDPTGTVQGRCTFDCRLVPHVTLRSIARNQALDPIFAHWDPQLKNACDDANVQLAGATPELRVALLRKAFDTLTPAKLRSVGSDMTKLKRALSDAEWRRWILPPELQATRNYTTVSNSFAGWYEWEMPFDTDPDWPIALQTTVSEYRRLWKAKMKEVNDCIAAKAGQEELVDKPFPISGVLRVSGPFTVEGVIPVEESIDLDEESPVDLLDDGLETFDGGTPTPTLPLPTTQGEGAMPETPNFVRTAQGEGASKNADSYLDQMTSLLAKDSVRFLNNKVQTFTRLERVTGLAHHAEGKWEMADGQERTVYVVFGPQYGPLSSIMVEDAIRAARRADVLLFAGFSFDAEAQHIIQDVGDPRLQVEMVQIRPDANPAMGGLLKNTVHQQLFTVSGTPRTRLDKLPSGEMQVTMEGVDIYNPIENTVNSHNADKVAAWFLDGDYDGRTFCVTQAFFPDKSAWEKIARHLDKSGVVDMERFEAFSGTTSLPFPVGKYKRVAIKVIDPRGNEVMKVHRLDGYQS